MPTARVLQESYPTYCTTATRSKVTVWASGARERLEEVEALTVVKGVTVSKGWEGLPTTVLLPLNCVEVGVGVVTPWHLWVEVRAVVFFTYLALS
jgi:hypothetical protein